MIKFLKKPTNLLFSTLLLLTIINIVQSYTTELLSDEAYYWVYSQKLDLGYFDHPPMVALWIYISNLFFANGELSVRFFAAFTLSATIFICWKLIEHPKKKEFTWLFLLIVLSTTLFNVYGFITVPDTPLLFFMALFLLGYKKYVDNKSSLSYFLISIGMAGMLYSKYQAILVILFVLFSNLKILKDGKFWIASLGSTILFAPHLYWQFINDFPTFRYHLYERTATSVYNVGDTLLHFVNIIAIIGLTFPIVYLAFYKNLKNKELFSKSLNNIVIGFIVFFFLMSFKGHVQAQWIVPISIPLIVITFYYLIDKKAKRKTFIYLASATLIFVAFIRIAMANDGILPKQQDMHGNKAWVEKLKTVIKGKQPIFLDSYQNASAYWFYAQEQPLEFNSWNRRKNQYDLLESNAFSENENIALIGNKQIKNTADTSIIKRNKTKLYIKYLSNYKNYKGLKVTFKDNISLADLNTKTLDVFVKNPYTNFDENNIIYKVVLLDKKRKAITNFPAEITFNKAINIGNNNAKLSIKTKETTIDTAVSFIQIIGQTHKDMPSFRVSKMEPLN